MLSTRDLQERRAAYLDGYPLVRVARLRAIGATWDEIATRIGITDAWDLWDSKGEVESAARLLWELDGAPGGPTWEMLNRPGYVPPDDAWVYALVSEAFFAARRAAFERWLVRHLDAGAEADAAP